MLLISFFLGRLALFLLWIFQDCFSLCGSALRHCGCFGPMCFWSRELVTRWCYLWVSWCSFTLISHNGFTLCVEWPPIRFFCPCFNSCSFSSPGPVSMCAIPCGAFYHFVCLHGIVSPMCFYYARGTFLQVSHLTPQAKCPSIHFARKGSWSSVGGVATHLRLTFFVVRHVICSSHLLRVCSNFPLAYPRYVALSHHPFISS